MILPFLKTSTAEKWIRFFFLAAVSFALELAIYVTGTFSEGKKSEKQKISKKVKREIDAGQFFLTKVG
jgi:hypothetical protein